ncbi:fumarylacetoacetate (FAA) hydrolase [Pseudopedobacter saltans DSM 12145]|uniref:Fumarylacetoacetate (FAA) hydrolase n=1 Tax=Pseudopedobacter saltans (strain ATCC 51119 / DSM 12145 / JCM 21818 / CCUG 39354 / LMG 10337 / NBRC 100064 / NCIMB 13643) TaxID=762903 RepID=F0SA03_PSESL|nr:fumarylacetoacetate hydrolase family protein [Pseudopedobacter saltans]ADY52561.1 fumarylacetoacetate (FAA) hydrolase [Pseudopedobacter saltans DSM 12145]
MKVIAIGRNYGEHARELNNPVPEKPVIFLKPDTAVSKNNRPFYIPDFSNDVHYEVELVLKVSKEGKHIAPKFAGKYYEEIGLGIDFTARDLQAELKSKGLPWELAKGFDNSAPVSEFVPISNFKDLNNINFSLTINGEKKQQGNTKNMLFSFDEIISFVSQYITLKKGDLIFTGTPAGVGKVNIGDKLVGYIENNEFLNFEVK